MSRRESAKDHFLQPLCNKSLQHMLNFTDGIASPLQAASARWLLN
jgi:hypothetical protein